MGLLDEEKRLSDTNDGIVDIDLKVTQKKRFRLDGDNNRILELDTSDLSILNRLEPAYKKLLKLAKEASSKMDFSDDASVEEVLEKAAPLLSDTDKKMRAIIDELFDANVSEVCAPSGSMYDPFNGQFRFEHIIDVLTNLYTANLNNEFQKMSDRISKHTKKYTH